MKEITEEIREGIVMHIGMLTVYEATRIAGSSCSSIDTVYRYLRELKRGKRLFKNIDVIMALTKCAIEKKKEADITDRLSKDLQRQLSAKPKKQAA